MKQRRMIGLVGLIAALGLSGCGSLPGVNVAQENPTSLSAADQRATIEAEVRATLEAEQAQQPTASAEPTDEPTEAPTDQAEPTATDQAEPTDEPAATEATQAPDATAEADGSPAAASGAPQAPVASGDGSAIVVTRAGTISVLKDGVWTAVPTEDDECDRSTSFAHFDDQGTGWFKCGFEYFESADASTWSETEVEQIREITFPIVAQDGSIYGAADEAFIRYKDGEVTEIGQADQFGAEFMPTVSTGAFFADGTGYIAVSEGGETAMYRYDGNTWTRLGLVEELGLEDGASEMIATSDGELLAGAYVELFKLEGDTFTPLVTGEEFGAAIGDDRRIINEINAFAELPDGRILMATESGLFTWDGSEVAVYDRTNGLPANNVTDVAVDANGTIWAATQAGVAVQNGDSWTVAVPSTSDLTDTYAYRIAVTGAPTLPEPSSDVQTASITGRVSQSGQAIGNTEVEVCSEIPSGYNRRNQGDTPCANQFYTQKVTTDDQGNFTFENVPIGTYTMTFFSTEENNWVSFINLNVVALEPGAQIVQDLAID